MPRSVEVVFANPASAFGALLAAALLLTCPPAAAQAQRAAGGDALSGVVFHDANSNAQLDDGEERLDGVRVSNMSGFTRTDEAGTFTISVEAPGIVFAVKPPGYQFPLQENGVPAFYYLHYPEGTPASADLKYDGVAPTGPAPDTLFFPMRATDEEGETVANVVGDPQIPRPVENTFFRNDVMPDLLATDADFSLFLGDIADNDLRIFPHFERSVKLLDQPLYMAFGNHDVNFRADGNARRAETYRAHFGPDYYSFNYGASHFVVLNDVDYEGWNEEQGKRGSYYGRIGEEQMEWFKKDIAGVEPGRPVYLVTHIPLHPRFFDVENLAAVLDVVEEREQVAALSGHLHGFMSWPYDENPSWEGADEDARGYSLGATSGAWWTGPFASDSIPAATATDGTPNGFFRFTFDAVGYTYDFIPAGEPRDFQLRVSAPHNYVVQDARGRDSLVVNVFAGDERATVTARFDDRAAVDTLRQFTGRDPFVVRTHDRRINRDDWSPGIATTSHLWRSPLPEDLALGTHTVTVRATLPNGKTYRARHVFEVVESAPDAWATR
jgi:hypothetical protein